MSTAPRRRAPKVVDVLMAAQGDLLNATPRRHAAEDVVSQLLGDGRYTRHEYLSARLEVAHAHMVERDMAERAVMAVLDVPPPSKVDAGEARRLLSNLLGQYGWHRWALQETVHSVDEQHDQGTRAEAARRRRRAASLPASVPIVATISRSARTAAR